MRALLLLLFASTAIAAPPTPFPQESAASKPPPYLVRLYFANEDGDRSMGTGTLIAPNLVLTASHVVDGKIGAKVEVMFFTDWSVALGEVMDVSANDGYEEGAVGHDVAVIRLLTDRKDTYLPVAKEAVKGDVLVEGYAHGPHQRIKGVYYTHDRSNRWGVIRGAQARNGDSGGPIIQNGKLIGVLWGASDGYTWFTTVEKIIELFPEFVKPTEDPKADEQPKVRRRPKYSLR